MWGATAEAKTQVKVLMVRAYAPTARCATTSLVVPKADATKVPKVPRVPTLESAPKVARDMDPKVA